MCAAPQTIVVGVPLVSGYWMHGGGDANPCCKMFPKIIQWYVCVCVCIATFPPYKLPVSARCYLECHYHKSNTTSFCFNTPALAVGASNCHSHRAGSQVLPVHQWMMGVRPVSLCLCFTPCSLHCGLRLAISG